MSRERAQALVEVAVAIPLCVACSLAIVDGGIVVRDRVATAQAATRAAEARLSGDDAREAARDALPSELRGSVRVLDLGSALEVRTRSRSALGRMAGRPVTHRSHVQLPEALR